MATDMNAAFAAAQEFVASLNANSMFHSVWIGLKDNKDPDQGYEIKMSIRPRFKHKFDNLPNDFKGISICQVPWPKEQ
jgi:hypothetical protein